MIPDNTRDWENNLTGNVTEMVRGAQPQRAVGEGPSCTITWGGRWVRRQVGLYLGQRKTRDVPIPVGWLQVFQQCKTREHSLIVQLREARWMLRGYPLLLVLIGWLCLWPCMWWFPFPHLWWNDHQESPDHQPCFHPPPPLCSVGKQPGRKFLLFALLHSTVLVSLLPLCFLPSFF